MPRGFLYSITSDESTEQADGTRLRHYNDVTTARAVTRELHPDNLRMTNRCKKLYCFPPDCAIT